MQQYIGTKTINAKPMTRLEYNQFRGWTLPADKNGADDGYMVEYTNGGTPNTKEYAGYISWSPKEQFDNSYQANGNLSFGHALVALNKGKKLARTGWNGKDMFIYLFPPAAYKTQTDVAKKHFGETVLYNAYFAIRNVNNTVSTWVPSVNDCLANDWQIVE